MRSQREINERMKQWIAARDEFYPHQSYYDIFNRMVVELADFIEDKTILINYDITLKRYKSRLRKKFPVEKKSEYFKEKPVVMERKWAMGIEPEGALKKVLWILLIEELHDARCKLKKENSDIILEGTGCPPDIENPGRKFRFWLKLNNCQFKDEREANDLSIELVWILYPEPSFARYIIKAQDDTLSGLLWFDCEDYEYRIWGHSLGKGKMK